MHAIPYICDMEQIVVGCMYVYTFWIFCSLYLLAQVSEQRHSIKKKKRKRPTPQPHTPFQMSSRLGGRDSVPRYGTVQAEKTRKKKNQAKYMYMYLP